MDRVMEHFVVIGKFSLLQLPKEVMLVGKGIRCI